MLDQFDVRRNRGCDSLPQASRYDLIDFGGSGVAIVDEFVGFCRGCLQMSETLRGATFELTSPVTSLEIILSHLDEMPGRKAEWRIQMKKNTDLVSLFL
jgi:hypothetical protein